MRLFSILHIFKLHIQEMYSSKLCENIIRMQTTEGFPKLGMGCFGPHFLRLAETPDVVINFLCLMWPGFGVQMFGPSLLQVHLCTTFFFWVVGSAVNKINISTGDSKWSRLPSVLWVAHVISLTL